MKGKTYEYFDLRNYIQSKSAYKNLPQKLKAPPEMVLDSYKHITFVVESVSEYLQVLQIIKRNDRFSDRTYAFRGMSDYTFNMLPSIARKSVLSLAEVENRMVNEFLTLRPGEFSGITSNFDLLAKMQHFGLPTRLLDFSLNPLIALYFACADNPQKIARVVCTNYPSSKFCLCAYRLNFPLNYNNIFSNLQRSVSAGRYSFLRRYRSNGNHTHHAATHRQGPDREPCHQHDY